MKKPFICRHGLSHDCRYGCHAARADFERRQTEQLRAALAEPLPSDLMALVRKAVRS